MSVSFKGLHIEPESFGDIENLLLVQRPVIFEQLVMEPPVLALPVCCKGGHCGLLGISVDVQGEIFYIELDLIRILTHHLMDERLESRAGRSLIVSEYSNGDRGIFKPQTGQTGKIKVKDVFQLNDLECFGRTAGQDQGVFPKRICQPIKFLTY